MKNTNILYLLGSGRSGTTLLATILNSTNQVFTAGELHQFYTYMETDAICSCGDTITNCFFWNQITSNLNLSKNQISKLETTQNQEEAHRYIPFILLGRDPSSQYKRSQNILFKTLSQYSNKPWILDSSKYISRFLLLKKTDLFNLKGIYLVRDVRGVINSFNKPVQTPRKPLNTILYYSLTNFFGQLVYMLNKNVVKIRYEDLVQNPNKTINTIYQNLLETKTNQININEDFEMPHIIGGNRLKNNKSIKIKSDESWKQNISRTKQILYYLLCLPFMLINKYKL